MESPEEVHVDPTALCGLPAEKAYDLLGTSRKGLSQEEAEKRLAEFGENVLTAKKPKPMWMRFGAHLVNMFALLLWVATVLAFVSDQAALGVAIIIVILVNAIFAFVQEYRAEKAIEALRNMLPPKAKVIRDGQVQEIDARALVPGDLMVIEEGDLISADARLVYSAELRVDNSALTGEVDPVVRRADVVCVDPPSITDVESFIFTGSTAVLGAGRGVVYATGMRTEFGKIAGLTQGVAERLSPLQKNIARLSRLISIIAVSLGIFFFAISKIFVGMETLAAVVFAIGIIVANVPEGLLPTLTMALSVAAQRMAKRNVLVKKLSSVETLGSTTVICTDKTGTLTANQMTVREVWLPGLHGRGRRRRLRARRARSRSTASPSPVTRRRASTTASRRRCSATTRAFASRPRARDVWTILGDPTEAAMLVSAAKAGFDIEELEAERPRRFEFPFDSSRKRMTVVCDVSGKLVAYVKGAPKETIELCTHIKTAEGIRPITDADRAEALAANDRLASEALRVIAVAERPVARGEDAQDMAAMEAGLTLLGLEAMQDPPRPEVIGAVTECHTAGIRIIMITGDYGLTAEAIARKIGIITSPDARVITGAMLDEMSEEDLKQVHRRRGRLRARRPRAQDAHRADAAVDEGGRRHDRRRRQRRAGAQGRRHRHRDGQGRHRRRARGRRHDPDRRQLRLDRPRGRGRPRDLRQHPAVPDLLPDLQRRRDGPVPRHDLPRHPAAAHPAADSHHRPAHRPGPRARARPRAPRARRHGAPAQEPGRADPDRGHAGQGVPVPGSAGRSDRNVRVLLLYVEAGWHWPDWASMASFGADADPATGSPATGIYMAATTMTLTGIVMAQVGNGFAMRTHRQSILAVGFFTNKLRWWGLGAELLGLAALMYVPVLQRVFSTAPLTLQEWGVMALFAPTLLIADEIRKFFLRRFTRKPETTVGTVPQPARDMT